MGLKEKQAIAGLDFGSSERSLKSNTGTDIKIELEAATFSDDMDAILYANQRGAQAVANGISKLCYDNIGKEAFCGLKIAKVKLVNHKEAGSRKIAVQGSVLELHGTFGDANTSWFDEHEIKEALENML